MNLPSPFSYILIVGLLVLYVVTWKTAPFERADFVGFYASARLWQSGQNPYDRETQCRLQATIRPDLCMPYAHPPVLLPLFALISSDDYRASYNRWSLLLLIVVAGCVWVVYQISGSFVSAVFAALFYPIFISITQGNVSPFLLFSVLLWLMLSKEKRDFWAGVALSLTVAKPQLALLLGLPLLFCNRKAFWGFCLGATTLVLISFALVGIEGFKSLVNTLIDMLRDKEPATDAAKMYSVTGLLARAGLSRLLVWPVFISAIIGLSFLWRRRFNLHTQMFGIVLALFAVPHLFMHDVSLLAIPLLLIRPAGPIVASCVLLVGQFVGLGYTVFYLLLVALGMFHLTADTRGSRKGVEDHTVGV
jgi:hypothetical protein